jgi:hypothetical protein
LGACRRIAFFSGPKIGSGFVLVRSSAAAAAAASLGDAARDGNSALHHRLSGLMADRHFEAAKPAKQELNGS